MGSAARHALAAALLLAAAGEAAAAPCGAGELVLPGTATCLRLGGVVRAEAAAGRAAAPIVPAAREGGQRSAALRAGGRVDLDARTPTAYGPLRAYVAVGTGGREPTRTSLRVVPQFTI